MSIHGYRSAKTDTDIPMSSAATQTQSSSNSSKAKPSESENTRRTSSLTRSQELPAGFSDSQAAIDSQRIRGNMRPRKTQMLACLWHGNAFNDCCSHAQLNSGIPQHGLFPHCDPWILQMEGLHQRGLTPNGARLVHPRQAAGGGLYPATWTLRHHSHKQQAASRGSPPEMIQAQPHQAASRVQRRLPPLTGKRGHPPSPKTQMLWCASSQAPSLL